MKYRKLNWLEESYVKSNWKVAFTNIQIHLYIGKDVKKILRFMDELSYVILNSVNPTDIGNKVRKDIVDYIVHYKDKGRVQKGYRENLLSSINVLNEIFNTANKSLLNHYHHLYIEHRKKNPLFPE